MLAGCGRGEPEPQPRADETPAADVQDVPETAMAYTLVRTFNAGIEGAKGLKGIAIGADDRIYLAGADGVKVLGPGGEDLLAWRTSQPAQCIAVDPDGNAYVGLRTKVEKYDSAGAVVTSWGLGGNDRGELRTVTGIAVSGPDVFVADAGNRRVYRFDLRGDFIDEIGKRDAEAGILGIVCPSPYLDCQVDSEGFLHVTNPGRLRVEKYKADGELLGFWGRGGMLAEQFSGCCNPINIALLPDGRTVTAEKGIPRVKVYDRDGTMLAFIGADSFWSDAALLDVAVDSKERIYVANTGDGNVLVFAPEQ